MNHKTIQAELQAMLANPTLKSFYGALAGAEQLIRAQAERLSIIDGVDVVARKDVKIERLKARIAELEGKIAQLERASAAQGEPVAWMRPSAVEPEFTSDALLAGYWMRKGSTVTPLHLPPPDADKARDQALEEAAKICDFGVKWTPVLLQQKFIDESTDRLAEKIRELKSAAPAVEPAKHAGPDWELTQWLFEFVRMYQGTLRNMYCDGNPVGHWISERVMGRAENPPVVLAAPAQQAQPAEQNDRSKP